MRAPETFPNRLGFYFVDRPRVSVLDVTGSLVTLDAGFPVLCARVRGDV